MSKIRITTLIFSLFIFLGIVFFQPLSKICVKKILLLTHQIDESSSFDFANLRWRSGFFVLSDLKFRQKNSLVEIKKIEYKPSICWKEFKFNSFLKIDDPKVNIITDQSNQSWLQMDPVKLIQILSKFEGFQISNLQIKIDDEEKVFIEKCHLEPSARSIILNSHVHIRKLDHLLKLIPASFLNFYSVSCEQLIGNFNLELSTCATIVSLHTELRGKEFYFEKEQEQAGGGFNQASLTIDYKADEDDLIRLEEVLKPKFINRLKAFIELDKGCFFIKNDQQEEIWKADDVVLKTILSPNHYPEISLSGNVKKERRTFPFRFEGKGEFRHFDDWDLDLFNKAILEDEFKRIKEVKIKKQSRGEFLIKTAIDGLDELDLKMLQEVIFPRSELKSFLIEKGSLNADVSLYITGEDIEKIHIDQIEIVSCSAIYEQAQSKLYVENLTGSLTIYKPLKFDLKNIEIDITFDHGSLLAHHLKEKVVFSGSLYYQDATSALMNLFAKYQGVVISLEASGSLDHVDLKVQTSFEKESFLSTLEKRVLNKVNDLSALNKLYFDTKLSKCSQGYLLEGKLTGYFESSLEEQINFSSLFDHTKLFKKPLESIIKAEFQSDHLTSNSYLLFLEPFNLKWHVVGDMKIKGQINSNLLIFDLEAKKAIYDSQDVFVEILENEKTSRGHFVFDFQKELWDIHLPLTRAKCTDKKLHLPFYSIDTDVYICGNDLFAKNIVAKCENIDFQGLIHVDFKNPSWIHLEIFPTKMEGKAEDLFKFLTYIPELQLEKISPEISGLFRGGCANYLSIFYNDLQCEKNGKIDLSLFDVEWTLYKNIALKELSLDLFFDFGKNALEIKEFKALVGQEALFYKLKMHECHCLDLENFIWNLDLSLQNEMMDLLHLSLSSKKINEEIKVEFNPTYNQIFNSPFNVSTCIFDKDFHLKEFKAEMEVKRQDVENLIALSFNRSYFSFFPIGDLQLDLFYDKKEEKTKIMAKSAAVNFLSQKQVKLDLEILKIKDQILLHKASCGDLDVKFKGKLSLDPTLSIVVEELNAKYLQSQCSSFSGYIDLSHAQVNFESFSLFLDEIKKDLKFERKESEFFSGNLRGSCFFKIDFEPSLSASGTFDIYGENLTAAKLTLKQADPALFNFSLSKGLQLTDLNMHLLAEGQENTFVLAKIKTLVMTSSRCFSCKKVKLCIAPEMISYLSRWKLMGPLSSKEGSFSLGSYDFSWENQIDTEFDFSYDHNAYQLHGTLKEGYYWIGKESIYLDKCYYFFDQGHLNVICGIDYQKIGFDLLTKIHFKEDAEIVINLKEGHLYEGEDERPFVEALCRIDPEGVVVQSLQGEIFGLEMSFRKNPRAYAPDVMMLTGQLKIDASSFFEIFSSYISQEIKDLNMGKGYELCGDVFISKKEVKSSCFRGFLKGRDFEICGCYFKTLMGEIEVSLSQVLLRELSLSDLSGVLKVKEAKIWKEEQDRWRVKIPEVVVQDFRPSLLKKQDHQEEKIKPFIIKDFHCFNLEGDLKNRNSLKGRGYLEFLNTFKTEMNILDIPIEIIGRIGFDLGMFMPVIGKLYFELSEGKVILKELKNTFSEGKRSRFYLSGYKDSYIGLDGQLLIDIKMKQYVLLKITEPFTLSIRGSLINPKYSLR